MQYHRMCIKMNEIVNDFSLAGNKLMPEMHLKQPEFTYNARGPFTESKERSYKIEIQAIFTKMNLIKHAFNMIWIMEV